MNRKRKRPNWFSIILLSLLVLGGAYVDRFIVPNQPQFGVPTPTSTRSPESFVTEAQQFFKDGKLIAAIASYQQAIISNPDDPALYVALAKVQVFAGQYPEAQKSAANAILLNPDNSMAYAVLAWAQGFQAEYVEAEKNIQRALELDDKNALAHAYYVEILVDSGSFDVIEKATEESRVAIALAPDTLETHRARGIILEATQNYEEAVREFQLAIDINPKIADLYLSLGSNYRALGSYKDAIDAFASAISLNPQDPMPYYLTSRTYAQEGQYGTAQQYAKQAVDNDPTNTTFRGNLGVMYYVNFYFSEAIVEFGYVVNGGFTTDGKQIEARPLVPNDVYIAEYYYMYGLALAKTNKCSEALEIARTIFERIPADENAVQNANAILTRCEQNLKQTPVPPPASTGTAPVSPAVTLPGETLTPTP